jgi:Na+-driven multidrug efflux pump
MTRSILVRIILGACAITALLLLCTWLVGGFVGLSGHGVAALIIGIVVSMFLGIGLMVAVFASSRSGHDDAAGESTASFKRPSED